MSTSVTASSKVIDKTRCGDTLDSSSGEDVGDAGTRKGKKQSFRFGIITDTQHADIDDAIGASGKRRKYRGVLKTIERAGRDFSAAKCAFLLDLGDMIDRRGCEHRSAMRRVNDAYKRTCGDLPRYILIGNHDQTVIPRRALFEIQRRSAAVISRSSTETRLSRALTRKVLFSEGENIYFKIAIPEMRYCVIGVDTYDLAMANHAYPKEHPKFSETRAMYAECKHKPHVRVHKELNGGVGREQLRWLREQLSACRKAGDRAIVASHAPLIASVTYFGDAMCWNADTVLSLLHEYTPDVVVAVISGHDHIGDVKKDKSGLLHVVVPAALEAESGDAAYAVVDLWEDELAITGKGHCAKISCRISTKRHGASRTGGGVL